MAEKVGIKEHFDKLKANLDKALHDENAFTNVLKKIEEKTGVKRLHVVLGLGVLTAIWLMVGYGSQFLCNFLGFIYPAYASIKAIETKEKDDDTKWLTYWVVYSFFSLIEMVTDVLFFWIPFYCLLKMILLVYLFFPGSSNGSVMIYNKIVRPYVLKHEAQIDKALNKAKHIGREILDEAEGVASEVSSDAIKHRAAAVEANIKYD